MVYVIIKNEYVTENQKGKENKMWQAWINGLLGIWLFIVAFLNFGAQGNKWDDLIVGIIVAIVGYLMIKEKPWQAWLSIIIGIWLIIAAFIPSLVVGAGNMWSLIISGILVMVGGFGALGGGQKA